MINFKTLSIYLFRLYCSYFIVILVLLIGVFTLSNIFDLLQQSKAVYIPTHSFWKLVLYKIPYLVNEAASLLSFITMLLFLRRLTKHNELITILCNGINIWRVIAVPFFAAIILGIILITICNPIGTFGLQKYESLKAKLFKNTSTNLIISKSGLLFFENYQGKKRIVQAGSIDIVNNKLNKVIILFLDDENSFLKRIDAQYAILIDNNFELTSVKLSDANNFKQYENFTIPTNLSINNLLNSFITPEMIAIWDLPDIIQQLVKFGLPITNYQIYFYKQLFKPIIMATTVILAACFFSLRQRDNSQEKILVIGLFLGFIIYSLLEVLFKILAYNATPPFLAILLPNICILFFSNFVIMHSKKI
ncbi:LptF/LptG family permease [Rickettsia endosymbiont of Oedothorax gibbosus]|uniref:LptF/LptG family permease n=1 Tax=Rickettsia endosymbiont of Oedothorax gibbosus TaxID=931099 RepID=UPI002023C9CC|nr:LptF/LptG family permease [Rickettsia endosymbiont of Oedothorax gibbosus]